MAWERWLLEQRIKAEVEGRAREKQAVRSGEAMFVDYWKERQLDPNDENYVFQIDVRTSRQDMIEMNLMKSSTIMSASKESNVSARLESSPTEISELSVQDFLDKFNIRCKIYEPEKRFESTHYETSKR